MRGAMSDIEKIKSSPRTISDMLLRTRVRLLMSLLKGNLVAAS